MKILLTKWSFQYWNRDRKWLLEQFDFDISDIWPCWIQREDTREVSTSRGNSPIIADSAVCQNCSYSDKLYVLKLPETETNCNKEKLLMLISWAEMIKYMKESHVKGGTRSKMKQLLLPWSV